MKCDCGKPSRITSRGKSQCWDCFDNSRGLPTGVSKVSGHPNIPKSILTDPHWDGTWPEDGFDYSKAQKAVAPATAAPAAPAPAGAAPAAAASPAAPVAAATPVPPLSTPAMTGPLVMASPNEINLPKYVPFLSELPAPWF